jgi:heptosyltransferase II
MLVKKLERAWKRACFAAIHAGIRARGARPSIPDWTSGPRRVLFFRPDGIGDAIVSTPLLRAISGLSPDLRLDVVGSPANAALLRRLDYVENVLVFNKRDRVGLARLARQLQQASYDAVIDPRIIERSMTGLLLMLAAGAPLRVGVGGRDADGGLSIVVPHADGHITDLLAGFAAPFGLDATAIDWRPVVPLAGGEREWGEERWSSLEGSGTSRRLLINVSAGEPSRAWPEDRFVAAIEAAHEARPDVLVAVIGAPAEQSLVARIADRAGAAAVSTPSLGELTAIVATSDLVFTPDTSVVHIAAAFHRPTIAMYLRGTRSRWGALGVEGENLESPDRTLRGLSLQSVVPSLVQLLQAPSGLRPS